ncbi:MAG: hypothetical protein H7Y60_09060 [Rhodospirillaceae bacterium]|nr:hypothetical protein [Rhodospirillales bacterium]
MPRRLALVTAAALLGFALPAYSQTEPLRITITKVDCSRLVRHTPSADVAYKPGEGVNGRKVAPADVPGSGAEALPNLLPDVLEIPLTVKPLSGAAYATRGLGDSTMNVGTVRYDIARNSFTFNGQPLGGAEQHELAQACAKRGVR